MHNVYTALSDFNHLNSIWPHLSFDLVRSKREHCQNCSLLVVLCSCL